VNAVNQTQQTIVARGVHRADHFWARLKGLMFSPAFPDHMQALLLHPCNSIHTFFMRYPIDVLFLAQDGQVLHQIEAMAPWRMSKRVGLAKSVLELPAHSLAASNTQLHDRIEFQP
jgi:uncharacterized membrane protein (UPF0127 family)